MGRHKLKNRSSGQCKYNGCVYDDINNFSFLSGWRHQAMLLDATRLYSSHDVRTAAPSCSLAMALQCKSNVPLYVLPHDVQTARRILKEVCV